MFQSGTSALSINTIWQVIALEFLIVSLWKKYNGGYHDRIPWLLGILCDGVNHHQILDHIHDFSEWILCLDKHFHCECRISFPSDIIDIITKPMVISILPHVSLKPQVHRAAVAARNLRASWEEKGALLAIS